MYHGKKYTHFAFIQVYRYTKIFFFSKKYMFSSLLHYLPCKLINISFLIYILQKKHSINTQQPKTEYLEKKEKNVSLCMVQIYLPTNNVFLDGLNFLRNSKISWSFGSWFLHELHGGWTTPEQQLYYLHSCSSTHG